MSAFTLARTDLMRMLRDKGNLISMLTVPILITLFLGNVSGEAEPTVTVARTGAIADALAVSLENVEQVDVQRSDPADVRDQVGRGDAMLGVIVPDDAAMRLGVGEAVEVDVVTRPDSSGRDLQPLVTD